MEKIPDKCRPVARNEWLRQFRLNVFIPLLHAGKDAIGAAMERGVDKKLAMLWRKKLVGEITPLPRAASKSISHGVDRPKILPSREALMTEYFATGNAELLSLAKLARTDVSDLPSGRWEITDDDN